MPVVRDIKAIPASIPYDDDPPTVFRDSWGVQLYVKVDLGGVVGWGEVLVYGSGIVDSYMGVIKDVVAPALVNTTVESIGDINELTYRLDKLLFTAGLCGVVTGAMGGVEMALWDAYAKHIGRPLRDLLGAPRRDRVPVYASFPRYERVDYVLRAVDKALGRGFTMVKLHEHYSKVPETLRAIRERFGYGVKVAVDLNAPFETAEKALSFIDGISRYEPYWVEEPTWPPNNHGLLGQVASKSPIPVAAGENEYNIWGLNSLKSVGVSYIQPDISKVGGVSRMVKIVKELAESHVKIAPHHRPHRPILAHTYTLHIASVIDDVVTVEWPLAEWPRDLMDAELEIMNGEIDISKLAKHSGVGVNVNEEVFMGKYRYTGGFKPLIFH